MTVSSPSTEHHTTVAVQVLNHKLLNDETAFRHKDKEILKKKISLFTTYV